MKTLLLAGLAALIAAFLPAPVPAQEMHGCAPRDHVLERLATAYGETRRAMGLGANNAVVEVFASDHSGSWTIAVTLPGGPTCLVASGQAFEAMTDPPPVRDKGA